MECVLLGAIDTPPGARSRAPRGRASRIVPIAGMALSAGQHEPRGSRIDDVVSPRARDGEGLADARLRGPARCRPFPVQDEIHIQLTCTAIETPRRIGAHGGARRFAIRRVPENQLDMGRRAAPAELRELGAAERNAPMRGVSFATRVTVAGARLRVLPQASAREEPAKDW